MPDNRRATLWALGLIVAFAALCVHTALPPRHEILSAVPDTLRGLAAIVVVFGVTGGGVTRLLLPAGLARYRALWILPAGACTTGLALTLLGFAAVPYPVALALVLLGGLTLTARAFRRRGGPAPSPGSVLWPVFLALLVLGVALIPMILRQHYAAPVGTGSDAHAAAGAANFLQHAYPTSVDVHLPVNQMPWTWKSKFPIYYAFAAVSTVSGLATWQMLPILIDSLLALAAVGLFLVVREVFRAPERVALVAMGLAGLDRMALHTVLHPYLNQSFGYFAMPFTVALGWHAVQPDLPRDERRGALALTVAFLLLLVFAYPLAAPIPLVPLAVFAGQERRRRIRAGEPVVRLRRLYRGRRSLLWLIPAVLLLAVPAVGVGEKIVTAAAVLAPGHSLQAWAGDGTGFIPFGQFISMPGAIWGGVFVALILGLAAWGLRGQPRALASGLGGLLAIGTLLAVYLRQRPYGFYFHFKLLAFIGPLVLVLAVLGAARLRGRAAGLVLAALCALAAGSVVTELDHTGAQVSRTEIALAGWAAALPPHATVRLDTLPSQQLWVAYFMHIRPLCSLDPLLGTDYPHVAFSRHADYILVWSGLPRPLDAVGGVLRRNADYRLYRESPTAPGPAVCTYRRYDRIYTGPGHSAN